jgi:hypothetical protein
MQLAEIEQRLLALQMLPTDTIDIDEVLAIGEAVLCCWITATGAIPTDKKKEGYRLLALHRQGAKGDPSFNACRESCRELIYQVNVVKLNDGRAPAAVTMALAVAYHLCLFIGGKLTDPALGDFCCSSRPSRMESTEPAVSI